MNENTNVVIVIKRAQPEQPEQLEQPQQLSGVFSSGPPIQIQWPQPSGLKTSAALQYDWIELYLTPVSI